MKFGCFLWVMYECQQCEIISITYVISASLHDLSVILM